MTQQQPEGKREEYGDPIKLRLAAEFWRIVDDLTPRILADLDYITENKSIDGPNGRWVAVLDELGFRSLELKYSIQGMVNLLTKDDAAMVRPYSVCEELAMKREDRKEVPLDRMEGRAEDLAQKRLRIEDKVVALYYQIMDLRGVAYKRKMWDLSGKPMVREHQT